MKKLIIAFSLFALIVGGSGCEKKDGIHSDTSFLSTATVGTTGKIFDISNDNSGNVTITPTGTRLRSFQKVFQDRKLLPAILYRLRFVHRKM